MSIRCYALSIVLLALVPLSEILSMLTDRSAFSLTRHRCPLVYRTVSHVDVSMNSNTCAGNISRAFSLLTNNLIPLFAGFIELTFPVIHPLYRPFISEPLSSAQITSTFAKNTLCHCSSVRDTPERSAAIWTSDTRKLKRPVLTHVAPLLVERTS